MEYSEIIMSYLTLGNTLLTFSFLILLNIFGKANSVFKQSQKLAKKEEMLHLKALESAMDAALPKGKK